VAERLAGGVVRGGASPVSTITNSASPNLKCGIGEAFLSGLTASLTARRSQKLSKTIRRIVFTHDGDTVTCALGEQIEIEKPQRVGRRGKINPYLAPLRTFDAARVVRIEDAGPFYEVTWDPRSGPSAWANPFIVGKHDALRVEFEGQDE
jgi:hypothetical protein